MQGQAKILHPPKFQVEPGKDEQRDDPLTSYIEELHNPAFIPKPRHFERPEESKHIGHSQPSKTGDPKKAGKLLLNLGGRVIKLDKRIDRVETHIEHILDNQITYRHLALAMGFTGFFLTVLVIGLGHFNVGARSGSEAIEQTLLQAIGDSENYDRRQSALTLLSQISDNPSIKQWANKQIDKKHTLPDVYRWPLEKQRYSKTGIDYESYKRGINIQANLGDAIVAMQDGEVVYSGNGIAGYGNLILIQHESDLISVYGNNYSNYVKEGMRVKQGQLIAAVGESTGNKPALYFEVRYKGEPEDPFLYFSQ